jgi:hypothetical protein
MLREFEARDMACRHEGTIWQIRTIDGPTDSAHGWECTRCGTVWDENPAVAAGSPCRYFPV